MHRLVKKLYHTAEELYINRRTRQSIKAAAIRLETLQGAWDVGIPYTPEYHGHMKDKLRRDWSILANALDKACE